MSSKLLVIIGTGDKEKAVAGLMYSRNVLKNEWLDDVKVVFFGPSEKLAAFDPEIKWFIKEIATRGAIFACKAVSDKLGVSESLGKIGVKVEYVGTIVSNAIKEGYLPMVW
ncbi:MAG: hypothetical protein JSW72_00565 [Candidatus Bathyarchaeota archaeon]|nr:MAG: hypothetical protein JSW72_00565 [Candidatus Bathyarchaeota archaeon]